MQSFTKKPMTRFVPYDCVYRIPIVASVIIIYNRLFCLKAVRKNAEAIAAIEEFKKELEGVKETLEENQKHLFQPIMAPLAGGKALMKGKLVHTNDVMVFLGDKWFVRTSAARAIDICNRKIASKCKVRMCLSSLVMYVELILSTYCRM